MSPARQPLMTGGCQCGAVRYAIYEPVYDPHICHCRMCQKAFGSFFERHVGVMNECGRAVHEQTTF